MNFAQKPPHKLDQTNKQLANSLEPGSLQKLAQSQSLFIKQLERVVEDASIIPCPMSVHLDSASCLAHNSNAMYSTFDDCAICCPSSSKVYGLSHKDILK
jgi:hypothetical protein